MIAMTDVGIDTTESSTYWTMFCVFWRDEQDESVYPVSPAFHLAKQAERWKADALKAGHFPSSKGERLTIQQMRMTLVGVAP